ncbi:MAG: transposase [Candidatus Magasanikbacteria bacterium RIFCSPHIGHO2_01_FULL_41_23]|uniref:Transposase n=1 Tax=Candidatus Magasanikbacteria bacterium RIFCSPLOWO2_01_FULL_40_15 TaxID=1798686 RepID=A0A1F6N4K7_9BACT|nr:MAG: transposase [Candidatus Magasanikbacteria bacterium RIFCSPHIGHO2_01_FULL_41_23]OGH66723.1 MAG: transposase [Candidatus Magasanikbacteria bacterium RIFCSPHIGHO2_02_FULL_41_35]OGH74523.1 MAG: transposase [Candidatus Magasanikbacteria bacterium RIFCSPHIGHO2_12_FULL_41_16]OGH78812.1 MAG: transposase [Candidatus Magasanikbacteria bacterium RIFCSPLOWO2_01_FULL_40_15]
MSQFIHKSHNVTVLLYHIVFPAKYRRAVSSVTVDTTIKEICLEISKRYEITFLEIGTDKDHIHFLIQSVPMYPVKKIVQIVKSITAKEVFKSCPEVKQQLWGGEFWSDGYYASTVGLHGNEHTIQNYVKNQGKPREEYLQLHTQQLVLI